MINFKGVQRPNPQDKDLPKKFYPQLVKSGEISLRHIADELSDASTLNSVDVVAVLFGLEKIMLKYLQNGYIVKFGDVGTFRPSLLGSGEETADLLGAGNVKKVKIVFSPSHLLKKTVEASVVRKVQES